MSIMHIYGTPVSLMIVILALAAFAIGLGTACQQPAQSRLAAEADKSAAPSAPPVVYEKPANLCSTTDWIAELLAEARDEGPNLPIPTDWTGLQVLTEQEVDMFIEAGVAIIPELMKHVHDRRLTKRYLHFPLYMGVYSEPKMVGEIACYLIEAVLRANPYFSTTGRLLYPCSTCSDSSEVRRHALDQAADAYEEWFRQRPDIATTGFYSPPEEMPVVQWDYDWQAWPRLQRATTQPWLELQQRP
jgi:hypothetical protein